MGRKQRHASKPHAKSAPAKGEGANVAPERELAEAVPAEDASAQSAAADAVSIAAEPADAAPAEAPAKGKPAAQRPQRAAVRDPFALLVEYERKSLAHVAGLPEQIDAPGLWRGVGYRVGARRLASGFDEVVEILPLPQVTAVPGAQPWMLGVANVRGNLLPIVDLKQFLEGERTVLHEGQRMLVVRQPGGDVAVMVEELYGQRSFVEEQKIDVAEAASRPDVPLADGRYAHFIDRAYRIDANTWGVFSLDRLARTPEFRQAAA